MSITGKLEKEGNTFLALSIHAGNLGISRIVVNNYNGGDRIWFVDSRCRRTERETFVPANVFDFRVRLQVVSILLYYDPHVRIMLSSREFIRRD